MPWTPKDNVLEPASHDYPPNTRPAKTSWAQLGPHLDTGHQADRTFPSTVDPAVSKFRVVNEQLVRFFLFGFDDILNCFVVFIIKMKYAIQEKLGNSDKEENIFPISGKHIVQVNGEPHFLPLL
jgi:hypothetical protein